MLLSVFNVLYGTVQYSSVGTGEVGKLFMHLVVKAVRIQLIRFHYSRLYNQLKILNIAWQSGSFFEIRCIICRGPFKVVEQRITTA